MLRSRITLTRVLFGASALLLLFIAFLSYQELKSLAYSETMVRHTNLVKYQLEELISTMKDAEAGHRGYLLTRDSVYLGPYLSAKKNSAEQLTTLRGLVRDNPTATERLTRLGLYIDLRLHIMDETAQMTDTLFNTKRVRRMLEGKKAMDSVRSIISAMKIQEDSLLHVREARYHNNASNTPKIVSLYAISALCLFFLAFVKVSRDAKVIKRQYRTLKEQQSLSSAILDNTVDVIAVVNKEGRYILANDALLKLYGVGSEIIGRKVVEVFPRVKGTSFMAAIEEAFQNNRPSHRSISSVVVGRNLESYFIPMTNAEGQTDGVLVIGHDITEEMKSKEAMEQKNQELERANEELASFNYTASHDLQEPLRKIQTFSTLLAKKEAGNLSPEGKNLLDRLENAATRMRQLVQDLLAFSRLNDEAAQFGTVDLNEIVKGSRETLQAQILDKKAEIQSEKLPVVQGIPFQLQQLFDNLISNSLKYSKSEVSPVITISSGIADNNSDYIRISFKDNGIGFEPEYAERIFTIFARLHEKDSYGGTGIGLAICKRVAENHSGFIKAHSKPGEGATFEVYLPA